jgi:hypothetical protein
MSLPEKWIDPNSGRRAHPAYWQGAEPINGSRTGSQELNPEWELNTQWKLKPARGLKPRRTYRVSLKLETHLRRLARSR